MTASCWSVSGSKIVTTSGWPSYLVTGWCSTDLAPSQSCMPPLRNASPLRVTGLTGKHPVAAKYSQPRPADRTRPPHPECRQAESEWRSGCLASRTWQGSAMRVTWRPFTWPLSRSRGGKCRRRREIGAGHRDREALRLLRGRLGRRPVPSTRLPVRRGSADARLGCAFDAHQQRTGQPTRRCSSPRLLRRPMQLIQRRQDPAAARRCSSRSAKLPAGGVHERAGSRPMGGRRSRRRSRARGRG